MINLYFPFNTPHTNFTIPTTQYIDDEGNFYDPLAKDLDNDCIIDRYDNDFRDSDYFESTYDVEDNLHTKEETAQRTGICKIRERTAPFYYERR